MTFRVAIDVTSAVTQQAGVGRYTRELVKALTSLPGGPELQPFYVAPGQTYHGEIEPEPVGIRRGVRSWRMETIMRHLARRSAHGPWDKAQVYHAPDVVYPPVENLPVVMTVHDLSYILYPRYHTRLNSTYLRLLTPIVTRRARLVIADSEATARDLMEHVHVPERKVRVVYPSIASLFLRRPADERIKDVRLRFALPDSFILSVGTLEPRKNLSGMLRAYQILRERLPDAPPLILIGKAGWRLSTAGVAAIHDIPNVRMLGHVPDDDLASLYASCSVFVYPSLYEGWGLPVAEALSLGAPTLTSAVSSLPEVAGDAAVLIDPRNPEDIATALEQILVDTTLAARLRRAGPLQSAHFSRARWAAGTLKVYREAYES